MKYFLVVFNRGDRQIVSIEEFEDADSAVRERFHLEKVHLGSDVELVVLGAESQDALQRTHSRYFGVRAELTGVG